MTGPQAATRAETEADRRRYLEGRLREIVCAECSARVRVQKNSPHHTAVQWTGPAMAQCEVFATMEAAPGGRPAYETCPRLMASIDQAVAGGDLEVGPSGDTADD